MTRYNPSLVGSSPPQFVGFQCTAAEALAQARAWEPRSGLGLRRLARKHPHRLQCRGGSLFTDVGDHSRAPGLASKGAISGD
jgi:hypothetical protein